MTILSCFSTLSKAWQSVKAELRYRSEAHSKFAEEVELIKDCCIVVHNIGTCPVDVFTSLVPVCHSQLSVLSGKLCKLSVAY